MKGILALGLLLTTSCKPMRFTDTIRCPNFEADNVHVGDWDVRTYYVATPSSLALVDKTACVVNK